MTDVIYLAWTDPDTGNRIMRTFPQRGGGWGRLARKLNRKGIPYQYGAAVDSRQATRPGVGKAWRPDPRVWKSLGDAA